MTNIQNTKAKSVSIFKKTKYSPNRSPL